MSSSWPTMPISVAAQGSSAANVVEIAFGYGIDGGGAPTQGCGREGVALVRVAGLVSDGEPLLPLRGGPVGPLLGVDPARRLLLDPVVADGRGGRQRIGNVLVAQRLQERHVGALLLGDRRVVRPDPRVAVGLQLGAHAVALRALRRPAGRGRACPAGSARDGRTRGPRRTPAPTGHRWNRIGRRAPGRSRCRSRRSGQPGNRTGRRRCRPVRSRSEPDRETAGMRPGVAQAAAAATPRPPSSPSPPRGTPHVVGVRAGLALAQVESGRLDAPVSICPCCGDHRARVDAEEQRDHHDQQSAEAAADRHSAAGPAATRSRWCWCRSAYPR